jgi:opacity protein-like surface antigen
MISFATMKHGLLILLSATAFVTASGRPNHWLLGDLYANFHSGEFADAYAPSTSLGGALGYSYNFDRHWGVGFQGTYDWTELDSTSEGNFSENSLTAVQLLTNLRFRFFKHHWSPYVMAGVGVSFVTANEDVQNMPRPIEGLEATLFTWAATIGVEIPVNERVFVDVQARYSSIATAKQLNVLSFGAGIVYALGES